MTPRSLIGRANRLGLLPLFTLAVVYLVPAGPARAQAPNPSSPSNASNAPDPSQTRAQSQAQAHPELEQQRQQAQQQAEKSLDRDAIAVIDETRQAVRATSEGKVDEALAAVERASGKANVLLARNSAAALLPVGVDVQVIDLAPQDINSIRSIAKAAERAAEGKDYPLARVLLEGLTSEIRFRTYHLPLATYPAALAEAARFLSQKKTAEANATLLAALNTLVMIDRVSPLPVALAESAIEQAQAARDKDRNAALAYLAVARSELDRAKELGYGGNDPEYPALSQAVSDLEKQVSGGGNTESAFARLKEKVSGFVKRLTGSDKKSQP